MDLVHGPSSWTTTGNHDSFCKLNASKVLFLVFTITVVFNEYNFTKLYLKKSIHEGFPPLGVNLALMMNDCMLSCG